MADPYSSERYDPRFPPCGTLSLRFDGRHLRMTGGSQSYSYRGVSGKPQDGRFDYSQARQKIANVGPIPNGVYWIRPDELDDNLINTWLSDDFAAAWGRYRISIHPFTTTETFGRGGFFIHGGATRGSAGCIDLTSAMPSFVADLRSEIAATHPRGHRVPPSRCQIHLTVAYPSPPGDYPLPGAGPRYA